MIARWLRRLLWLAGFGCLWLPVFDEPPVRTGAYLQDVTTDAGTVAMITPAPVELACIVRDSTGSVVATVRDPGPRRRHALRITGLNPGTRYEYSLVDDAAQERDRGTLSTAPDGDRVPVKFAFLGDSGGLPGWVWTQRAPAMYWPARWGLLPSAKAVRSVGEAVAAYEPQFVLHLGDVVYPWGRHAEYTDGFFRPFAAVLRSAPAYAVIGNHDQMDCEGLQLLSNFHLPGSEPTGDGRCFSFAWGSVRVIGLDCNVDRTGGVFAEHHPSIAFLATQLRTCSEPWVLVASHFPMRSQSRQRNRGDLLLHLLPTLKEHRVSLYLSGHDHCYQRFGGAGDPTGDGVPLIVSGGGGKSLYEVRPDTRFVLESAYHWCSGEVDGRTLRVRSHRIDGVVLDEFTLGLPTGPELESIRSVNSARAARIEALR